MNESEDVLSLARLERQGLVPSFLIYHSKYKFWVLTPPWMLLVSTIYPIYDHSFNSLVTAWECGVRFCQTSHIETQNRKIPDYRLLSTLKRKILHWVRIRWKLSALNRFGELFRLLIRLSANLIEPRPIQGLNMFWSCFVKQDRKLFSKYKLLKPMFVDFNCCT